MNSDTFALKISMLYFHELCNKCYVHFGDIIYARSLARSFIHSMVQNII